MRTTVNIDDGLLETAKRRAERAHQTLGAFIEEALRRHLAQVDVAAEPGPALPVFTRGTGMAPDIDPTSNTSMLDALDDEDDVEAARRSRRAG